MVVKKCAMNKVCNLNDSDKKIIKELKNNTEGLRVKTIIKLTSLKQRVVYKRLNLLRDMELIENINPIWKIVHGQVSKCAKLIDDDNIFELHNISYVVKLIKTPDWWSKRKNYLVRLKEWQFKEVSWGNKSSNPYHQLMNENFVIQCYPESIIIIARKRYYAEDPYSTIKEAMSDALGLMDWFCERFRFNFFCDGVPHLEVRNNDFNRMNDALANSIKRSKGKFLVEIDKRRKVWVDMSEPFGKEANYPSGQEKLEKITKDYLTNEVLLPSEIQHLVGKNAQHLSYHAENMRSHVEVVRLLGNEVRRLGDIISKLENRL